MGVVTVSVLAKLNPVATVKADANIAKSNILLLVLLDLWMYISDPSMRTIYKILVIIDYDGKTSMLKIRTWKRCGKC